MDVLGITRKKEYRIQTVIKDDYSYKTSNSEEAQKHINQIGKNIEIINKCKINCLDTFENNTIISKFLKDSVSFDKELMNIYYEKGLTSVIKQIKYFKNEILDKLEILENPNSVILITGKGNETRQKIGTQYVPCLTDTQYAQEALEEYNNKIK